MKLPKFENPLKLFTPALAGPALGTSGVSGRNMMFSSGSGGGGYDDDDYGYDDDYPMDDPESPEDEPQQRSRAKSGRGRKTTSSGRPDANGGRSRTTAYQPEERYWTDYLRIALPVLGIILMVGLLWVWASNLLGNDVPDGEPTPDDTIGVVQTQTPDPNEVNTEPTSVSSPGAVNGEIPISGAPTAVPAQPTAPTENTAATAAPTEAPAEAPAGEIEVGALVTIVEGPNIRSEPGTSGGILRQGTAGESAEVIGGPEEADDYTWWQVVFDDGVTGWVAEEYLEVSP